MKRTRAEGAQIKPPSGLGGRIPLHVHIENEFVVLRGRENPQPHLCSTQFWQPQRPHSCAALLALLSGAPGPGCRGAANFRALKVITKPQRALREWTLPRRRRQRRVRAPTPSPAAAAHHARPGSRRRQPSRRCASTCAASATATSSTRWLRCSCSLHKCRGGRRPRRTSGRARATARWPSARATSKPSRRI